VSRPAEERGRTLLWTTAAFLAAAVHFASFDTPDRPLVTDVRYFTYFAQRTAAGALPHRDFFENKTPLAIFLGAALHRGGAALGVEPLHAIRLGYLGLAALAAALSFAVHRTLGRGRLACGAFALALHCGFWLLGLLPATGNVSKLAMAAAASAVALCVQRRAWAAAGACGALAALDWQIGALAVAGALAAAWCRPAGERRRAGVRVIAGAGAVALPFAAVYAVSGGLGALWRQTVAAALAGGTARRADPAAAAEWARRWHVITTGTEGHTALLALALAGLAVYAWWLRAARAAGTLEMAAALGVYHYGLVAFTLLDFQLYGDLFALLHSACFFAAVALGQAYLRVPALAPPRARTAAVTAAVVCVIVARPWVDRASLRVPGTPPALTLGAQRQVARGLEPILHRPDTGVLGATELLFLSGAKNALPFHVWNAAAYRVFRRGGEAPGTALARLLDAHGVQRLVCDRGYPACAGLAAFAPAAPVGDAVYAVEVYERRSPAAGP
jgi:hypothetical protein